jgi:hypothetical protein
VEAHPFDLDAVRGLFQAFGAAEQGMGQRRLARQFRRLREKLQKVMASPSN